MNKLEAIEILLNVDITTVIDENWWDSFMEDPKYYDAMLVLSGMSSYKEILNMFEGFYIRDFICNCLNIAYQ